MKTSATFRLRCLATLHALSIAILAAAANAQPLTTAFTYQGELKNGSSQAAGLHDFRFRLWSALTGGSTLGLSPICLDNVTVNNGRFTARLDFGAAFAGQQRFLEIEVRQDTGATCSDSSGYTVLSPRLELTVAPNAAFALTATNATQLGGQAPAFYTNAANLTGALPSSSLAGSYSGALTLSNASNSFSGSGAGLINLSASNLSSGTLADARLSTNIPRLDTGNTFGNTINSFMGLVGIGTTSPNPNHLLHLFGTTPSIAIQDADSTTQQVGYVDFRDSANTSQGWVGFGSAGDPDFSIINARTGGDIVLSTLGGGKVGIGTASPAAALDVRGDIRLGPTGQFRATSGEENLRIIRGVIEYDGVILSGTGFTVTHPPTGSSQYTITFTTPFAGRPALTVTTEYLPTGSLNTIAQSQFVTSTSADVWTRDSDGARVSRFSFIAIGPR